jgi:hypothetical protein
MPEQKFTPEQIAPCGMNCGVCKAYLAYTRGVPKKKGSVSHCSGCRVRDKNCAFIKRDCPRRVGRQLSFCYQCPDMPCERLVKLDKLYQIRYGMSMIENQKTIRDTGMEEFLKSQREKYRCPSCGDVVSVHDGKCYKCGYQGPKPKSSDPTYRWNPNRK